MASAMQSLNVIDLHITSLADVKFKILLEFAARTIGRKLVLLSKTIMVVHDVD